MADKINFTIAELKKLPTPEKGTRDYYHDTRVNGLVLQVTGTGAKSFQVYRKVDRRPVRVTLGRFPDMTIEQARRLAQAALSKIAGGVDPNQEKRARQAREITLQDVFEDYLRARKALKPGTIKDYGRVMAWAFGDWRNKPLAGINREMVARRHAKLGERSKARANNSMRVLRAIFNFAAGEYEDEHGNALFPDNPVTRISHTRAWYRVDRRRTVIKPSELDPWHRAVLGLSVTDGWQAETVRDYLLLLLHTGLRREEAAALRRTDVDLRERTLTVDNTKNSEPHTLPLSDYVHDLLKERLDRYAGDFVFPSDKSKKTGHLVNPYKVMAKVTERSGVQFALHDLRRTFITIAEGLDISPYAVKRLVNHKMRQDVTAGYIISDVDRLRAPVQAISGYILKVAGVKESATVIDLAARSR